MVSGIVEVVRDLFAGLLGDDPTGNLLVLGVLLVVGLAVARLVGKLVRFAVYVLVGAVLVGALTGHLDLGPLRPVWDDAWERLASAQQWLADLETEHGSD